MHADFSVELGRDDPVLEIPWISDDPAVRYFDLKKFPELVLQIPEAVAHPDMGAFLSRINTQGFPLATAKCDAWDSREISPEEEIFGADRKFVSYVDLFFVDERSRCSFEKHEELAKELCRLLNHAPDISATVELVVRRCYYHQQETLHRHNTVQGDESASENNPSKFLLEHRTSGAADNEYQTSNEGPDTSQMLKRDESGPLVHASNTWVSGFYFTAYVNGFGNSEYDPRRRWEIAFALLQYALVQLSYT
jgi:hypothetical protein